MQLYFNRYGAIDIYERLAAITKTVAAANSPGTPPKPTRGGLLSNQALRVFD